MARRESREAFEDAWLALALAGIAGTVDAIGYLTLDHLFTAHMSGNTAAMGAEMGAGRWAQAWHRALPIPLFVAGVAMGYAVAELAKRRRVHSPFIPTLSVQALLLLAFLIWGGQRMRGGFIRPAGEWEYCALVALPALAMGLQNSTLHQVGNQNVRTTFISGMLTNFAEQSVELLFWAGDHARGKSALRRRRVWRVLSRQPETRRALLFIGIWCCFVVGAFTGSIALAKFEMNAVLLPLIGTLIVIAVDWVRPIALQQMTIEGPKSGAARHREEPI